METPQFNGEWGIDVILHKVHPDLVPEQCETFDGIVCVL
jgi:hypothetical protein